MFRQHRIAQLFMLFFLALSIATFSTQGQLPPQLDLDKAVDADVPGNQTRSFQFSAQTLEFARVTVTAKNISYSIKLIAPGEKLVAEYQWNQDSPETLHLSLIVVTAGAHRVELTSREKDAKSVSIKLAELRAINPQDPNRIEAERQFAKGEQLRPRQAAEDKRAG